MRIHHVALRVSDLDATGAFYRGILGFEEIARHDRDGAPHSVWFRAGDAVLMLERTLRGSGPEAGSGHVLALEVDELPLWEQRLAAAGVAIDDRTTQTLFVRDPEGHRVALSVFRFGSGRARR